MRHFIGQEKEVLFEEMQEIEGISCWVGHTMEYLKVAIVSGKNLENQKIPVMLNEYLSGAYELAVTVQGGINADMDKNNWLNSLDSAIMRKRLL